MPFRFLSEGKHSVKALSLVGGSREMKIKERRVFFFSPSGHFRGYIVAGVNST